MIKLVFIKNPFNIHERDIKTVDFCALTTLKGYAQAAYPLETELKISVNGALVDADQWDSFVVADNSYIVICPVVGKGGKDILGLVLGIALSIAAISVGGAFASSAALAKGVTGMAAWTFASYAAAAAVMYVGGLLVNNLMGVATVDSSGRQSATYSWEGAKTGTSQGTAVPLTFGKVKITNNNVLSAHATSDGDKQYLNLLICGGEGEVDSVTDIRIDANPLEYYKDIEYEVRLGTNNQAAISLPTFADAYADRTLSYELMEGNWSTQLLEGNANQGFEITISFSRGLFHANDDGGISDAWVDLLGQYRDISQGDWKEFLNTRVKGTSSSAIYRQFAVRDLVSGAYEVRVKVAARSAAVTSTKDSVRTYWTNLAGIMTDDFRYPNMVLVAIKALATSQLSGASPSVTWLQERKNVWVFNPDTGQYETKRATNPAWACYDILHLCRRLYDERTAEFVYEVAGAPAALIIYNDFARWAAACDERQLVCNYFLDTVGDLDAAWQVFEAAGRGKVVRRGTKYGCVFDHVAEAVQLFSVGNITLSSFNLSYLPVQDRANAVEITFNNERKDYTRDTLMVYTEAYESTLGVANPTQLTLDAITDPDRIYREGRYYLRKNEHLVRTVTFEADVDAVSCQVGDVVLVQHDVPQWGFGGRIQNVVNNNTLVLDHTVQMELGKQYEITIRLADDTIVKRAVQVNALEETATVKTVTPFDTLPQQYDVYSFGELNISTKPFTVVQLTRTGDTTVILEMLEYNEAVYAEADLIPEIEYSQLDTEIVIKELSLGEETYLNQDGTLVSNIYVSWLTARNSSAVKNYDVYYGYGATWFKAATTSETSCIIGNVKALTTYYVKVAANNAAGVLGAAKDANIYITGKNKAPAMPMGLAAQRCTGGVMLSWTANIEPDLAGYSVYIGEEYATMAESSLLSDKFKGTSIFVPLLKNAAYVFYVVAVDNVGNTSAAQRADFYLELPAPPQWFDVIAIESDLDFRWRAGAKNLSYEIRQGDSWELGTKLIVTSANAYRLLYPTVGRHSFWLKSFDEYGNYCQQPLVATVTITAVCDRNIVKTVNQASRGWQGTNYNAFVNSYGLLEMDKAATNAEHIVSVELPKRFKLRNWLDYQPAVLGDNALTWDGSAFAWGSESADRAWLNTVDNSGISLKNYIALWQGLNENAVDSISLAGTTTSTQGLTATESRNVTYRPAKFYDGAYIKDTTQLAWGMTVPAIFSLVFTVVTDQVIASDIVYLKLFSADNYLVVGYDLRLQGFFVSDKHERRNYLQFNCKVQDKIRIALVQSASSRSLFICSAAGEHGSDTISAAPIGIINTVYCYNKN